MRRTCGWTRWTCASAWSAGTSCSPARLRSTRRSGLDPESSTDSSWATCCFPRLSLFDADTSLQEEGRQDNEPGIIHPPHTYVQGRVWTVFLVDLLFYWFPKHFFFFFWEGEESPGICSGDLFFYSENMVFIISPLFWKSWPRRMVYLIARYRAFRCKNTREQVTLFVTTALIKDLYVNLDTISCAHESNITCTLEKLTLKFVNTQVS